MCGIAGSFAYGRDVPTLRAEDLLRVRDAMISRGPDGAGLWLSPDGKVGLTHRRLSIIDLSSAGAQPMELDEGELCVTFNGEIYNYREIRASLEAQGCRFRSHSDTEVLLHLYAREGVEMVHRLRGMFAFAIWDRKRRKLLLARDPFGIKPLYYSDDGRTFHFASQVRALLRAGSIDTSPDPAAHVAFFLWGSIPEPHTLYAGIRQLPAGCTLCIDESGPGPVTTYCDILQDFGEASQGGAPTPARSVRETVRDALVDSVRHHLVADVPVSLFLSSGLDSAALAGLASESASADLHTVTLAFQEFSGTDRDESIGAERIARHYGARHETCWITRADFRADLPALLRAMDQPSIDGVNQYFVCKAAASRGIKVALSGLGGDELFGGYPSFRDVPRIVRTFRHFSRFPALGRTWRAVSAPCLRAHTSPKYAGLLEYGGAYGGAYLLRRGLFMPWELPEVLDPDMLREGWKSLDPLARLDQIAASANRQDVQVAASAQRQHLQVAALEMVCYMRNQLLRDADWAGMAHSLEVRVPLVDLQLLRSVLPTFAGPSPPGKADMAAAPARALPPDILSRPKTGFSIPVQQWLLDTPDDNNPGPENRRAGGIRKWARVVYNAFSPETSNKGSARNRASHLEEVVQLTPAP